MGSAFRICIPATLIMNSFTQTWKRYYNTFYSSETASVSIDTEVIIVGEYVSRYARLSICENRRQWVILVALCSVRK